MAPTHDPAAPVRDGRVWLFPDGTRLPIVSGGADDNDGDGQDDDSDDEPLAAAGKRALKDERRARREAERKLAEVTDRLQKMEERLADANVDRDLWANAADKTAELEKRAAEAEQRAMRFEVALDKGLTAVQARRLVGSTIEELAEDADELLASFRPSDTDDGGEKPPPPPGKPRERLQGGGDPTAEPPVDIRSIVDSLDSAF